MSSLINTMHLIENSFRSNMLLSEEYSVRMKSRLELIKLVKGSNDRAVSRPKEYDISLIDPTISYAVTLGKVNNQLRKDRNLFVDFYFSPTTKTNRNIVKCLSLLGLRRSAWATGGTASLTLAWWGTSPHGEPWRRCPGRK